MLIYATIVTFLTLLFLAFAAFLHYYEPFKPDKDEKVEPFRVPFPERMKTEKGRKWAEKEWRDW